LKALGNKEGPHVLAADWVGTALADWLGLPTFRVAKLEVANDDEIKLGHGRLAQPGTAIAFKAESGASWGGSIEELRAAENVTDVGRLIVLDTWLLNCDRYPPDLAMRRPNQDNVFLSYEGAKKGHSTITAIDHTHCFSCGRDLNARLSDIGNVKDARIYGRFPEFDGFLDRAVVEESVAKLSLLDRAFVEQTIGEIADDWEVSPDGRKALIALICERAHFVTDTIVKAIFHLRSI
jgi:hypothetical protein